MNEALEWAVAVYPHLREQYALYKLLGVAQTVVLTIIGVMLVLFTINHKESDNPVDKLLYLAAPVVVLVVLRVIEVVYVTDLLFLLEFL